MHLNNKWHFYNLSHFSPLNSLQIISLWSKNNCMKWRNWPNGKRNQTSAWSVCCSSSASTDTYLVFQKRPPAPGPAHQHGSGQLERNHWAWRTEIHWFGCNITSYGVEAVTCWRRWVWSLFPHSSLPSWSALELKGLQLSTCSTHFLISLSSKHIWSSHLKPWERTCSHKSSYKRILLLHMLRLTADWHLQQLGNDCLCRAGPKELEQEPWCAPHAQLICSSEALTFLYS